MNSTPTDLDKVAECDADHHEFVDNLQKVRIGEHAVFEAVVQEVCVVTQYVINVRHLVESGQKPNRQFTPKTI